MLTAELTFMAFCVTSSFSFDKFKSFFGNVNDLNLQIRLESIENISALFC